MANALYDAGRDAFANGNIDWVNDTIGAVLVDAADYTVNLGTDDNLDDVPGAARVATATLTGKSTSAGVCDATDMTFTAVSGDQSEALVLYKDTGTEGTSTLIAYIDTATGLPVTPNGNDIDVVWDDGASKIFKL
jgi:hypothetical protein